MNTPAIKSSLQRVSPNFINVAIKGSFYENIRIQIRHENGEQKISLWEELNSGNNNISIDLSSLTKGNYSLIISDKQGQIRLEESLKL